MKNIDSVKTVAKSIRDIEAVRKDADTVKSNEASTAKILNARMPEVIAGVFAGDNPSVVSRYLNSMRKDRRQRHQLIVKKFMPNEMQVSDKGTVSFGKKFSNDRQVQAAARRFAEFLESSVKWMDYVSQQTTVEEKEKDYIGNACKSVHLAVTHASDKDTARRVIEQLFEDGLTFDTLSVILGAAAPKVEDKAA